PTRAQDQSLGRREVVGRHGPPGARATRAAATAATTLRAAFWDHQAGHEPGLLSDARFAQGGCGDEFDGPELQLEKSHQHCGSPKVDRSRDLKYARAHNLPLPTPLKN